MPNTSADERRGIIINYGSFHFKQTGVVQESARALEGIAFNRAHGATLFALNHGYFCHFYFLSINL